MFWPREFLMGDNSIEISVVKFKYFVNELPVGSLVVLWDRLAAQLGLLIVLTDVVGKLQQNTDNRLQTIGHKQPVTNNRLQTIGYKQPVTNNRLQTIGYKQQHIRQVTKPGRY